MRHLTIVLSAMLTTLPIRAGEPTVTPRPTEARPLLVGNWADPTVLKDGDDYYMTHSSFEFQPGLLIWHSKNLKSWRPITHAVANQGGSGEWVILQPGMDVSSMTTVGWHALRPALFATGSAKARFLYFRYRPMDP